MRERELVAVAQGSQASSNKADIPANGIDFALPGLTRRRSFDVMSFANCFLFCIGKHEGFTEMKLDDEFYFARLNRFIEFLGLPSRERETLTFLDRLNAEHSDSGIDLVWWPLLSASGGPFI
jgi:hypothetical protein